MKQLAILFIISLWAVPSMADNLTGEQYQALRDEAQALFTTQAQAVSAGQKLPDKCATPLFHTLAYERLAGEKAAMFPGREDTMEFTYGTAHFLLHFTGKGANRVYEFDLQDSLSSIPNFIFEAGKILESVYAHLTNDLGFGPPRSDGSYNGGGDGRLDVYFVDIGAYGATAPEQITTVNGVPVATTYMFMENDYQGFPGYENNRLNALRVSVAHELFHSFQFAMDVSEIEPAGASNNPAWIEMSAVFMEEEHYPNINDYISYLVFFYAFPHWSLRTGTQLSSPEINYNRNLHMYGSGIFPIFLASQFGPTIIKNIWDSCGAHADGNWWTGADGAIKARSGGTESMRSMFRLFTIWNLFTGNPGQGGWARGNQYFVDAAAFPRIRLAETISAYPATVSLADSIQPDNLGANYIWLTNLSSVSSGLAVSFSPDRSIPWGLQVVGLPAVVSNTNLPVFIDPIVYDSSTSLVQIPNAGSFNSIMLIPSVIGTDVVQANYSLSIAPLQEGLVRPNGGEALYAGSTYSIAWYFPESVDSILLELSTNNGQTWETIETTYNNFIYSWAVPNLSSDSCLIRASDADNPGTTFDVSNAVFSILSVSSDQVHDPYPNPAWIEIHDAMLFSADVKSDEGARRMSVTIANLAGELVWQKDSDLGLGKVSVEWNYTNDAGKGVAAGPYVALIRLSGDDTVYRKKIMVMK